MIKNHLHKTLVGCRRLKRIPLGNQCDNHKPSIDQGSTTITMTTTTRGCNLLLSRFSSTTSEDNESKDLVKVKPKEILANEFPQYYYEGKFIGKMSYVEFIESAMERIVELGIHKNLDIYKELIKVFPPGKFVKKNFFDIGLFSAPQQLAAVRLLNLMEDSKVVPDKEMQILVEKAFSKHSEVWLKLTRMNYWFLKGSNIDKYPLPKVLPKKHYELAKLAVMRMIDDPKALVTVTSTASIPDAIDKTWIVYSQSPNQKLQIDKLDKKTLLYIEEFGSSYVGDNYFNYYVLRTHDTIEQKKIREERQQRREKPGFNYNKLKVQFYGRPIKEKLLDLEDCQVDDGLLLGICMTGTSSQDSLLSWLKLLQKRNPKLKDFNVIFSQSRQTFTEVEPAKFSVSN